MSMLRVLSFAMSLDGFGAGPDQSLEQPLGVNGRELMEWFAHTRTWRAMHGRPGGEAEGETGVDDEMAQRGFGNFGAWILGRNMFGPVRGPWPDESWRGWWGDDPPYHVPAFVLTHHPRPPLELEGGTTFFFVTDGPAVALEEAKRAAGARDVAVAGGAATINTYLHAGDIDLLRLHIAPFTLGAGERLFDAVLGLEAEPVTARATPSVVHVTYRMPPRG